MSDTTIYFVETRTEDQAVAVCHWVEHFYDQGRRVQVLAGSAPAAQNLDQLLWTFAQGSFIPHRIVSSIPVGATVEPVVITPGEIPLDGFAVLICEGAASFDFLLRYQMVVHFVQLDEPEKRQDSRLLWQRLRDQGTQTIHVPYVPKGKPSFS
jgi:DNA polymerase III subunit chi